MASTDDPNVDNDNDYVLLKNKSNEKDDDDDDDDDDNRHPLPPPSHPQQRLQQEHQQQQEQQVEEMMRTLPQNDSVAYYEALQTCSSIVHTESPISRFLDASNGNISNAAQRLAEYWKIRLQLFQHRAYHPMTLREDGALFPHDRPLLDHASAVLIPRTDIWGRSMIFVDRARLSHDHSTYPHFDESKLRCLFVLFHMACCDNPMTQKDGMVLLLTANIAPRSNVFRRGMHILQKALPMGALELHFFFLPSRSTLMGGMVENLISYLIELSGLMGENVIVHRGPTDEVVVQGMMTTLGITKRKIPSWVGGTWTKDDYKRWLRSHTTVMKRENNVVSSSHARSSEAIKSQRKRQKQWQHEVNLHHQMDTLKSENENLQTENKCLEQLLVKAQEQLIQLE
jgi:hypothetical protein